MLVEHTGARRKRLVAGRPIAFLAGHPFASMAWTFGLQASGMTESNKKRYGYMVSRGDVI